MPAPVTFRGAPAPRYWEFEDARIEYGLLPVGPTDLAQLLMIEYASSYGNDWFVVPLTLPVGSLTSVNSLVVTDSFGVRTLLRPIGDRALPQPHWSMFQLAHLRRAGSEATRGRRAQPLLPAAGAGAQPGERRRGRRALHARRDGQPRVGHRTQSRKPDRAANRARRFVVGGAQRQSRPTRDLRARAARRHATSCRQRSRRTGSRCCRCSSSWTRTRSCRA